MKNHTTIAAVALALVAAFSAPREAGGYETDPEALKRLEAELPRTAAKLVRRAPVHVLSVGDSISRGFFYTDNRFSILHSFQGAFAARLAQEFFYTGEVRAIAPRRGNPEKLTASIGPEITIEKRARQGADIFYGFGPLTTDGFDNDPDLVMVKFGVNDASRGVSTKDFGVAAGAMVAAIRERGADALLIAPTPVFQGGERRFAVGAARRYAAVMRDAAEAEGAAFLDGGKVFLSMVPPPADVSAETALDGLVRRAGGFFDHGSGIEDRVHPNEAAHAAYGKALAEALLAGGAPQPIEVAGTATLLPGRGVRLDATVWNHGDEPVRGVVCPLALTRSTQPVAPDDGGAIDHEIEVAAGTSVPFQVIYETDTEGGAFAPDCAGSVIFPMLWVDEDGYAFADVVAPLLPVSVRWATGNLTGGGGEKSAFGLTELEVTGELVNDGLSPFEGTFVAGWNGQEQRGQIRLAPRERYPLTLKFPFPDPPVERAKRKLEFTIDAGGKSYSFNREIEVTRNFALGQRIALVPRASYTAGADAPTAVEGTGTGGGASVDVRVDADDAALFVTVDIRGFELNPSPTLAPVIVDLSVDGRHYEQRRTLGCSGLLTLRGGPGDGPLDVVLPSELAAFGSGYDRPVDVANVPATLATRSDGSRRITVTIPRAYFYLHEWAIGNGNSAIGLNAEVFLLELSESAPNGRYSEELQFVLSDPGMTRTDARSLPLFEMVNEATGRWTARLY